MAAPRLLVVDDDRCNCALVSTILANQGYRVDIAENGTAALQLAAR